MDTRYEASLKNQLEKEKQALEKEVQKLVQKREQEKKKLEVIKKETKVNSENVATRAAFFLKYEKKVRAEMKKVYTKVQARRMTEIAELNSGKTYEAMRIPDLLSAYIRHIAHIATKYGYVSKTSKQKLVKNTLFVTCLIEGIKNVKIYAVMGILQYKQTAHQTFFLTLEKEFAGEQGVLEDDRIYSRKKFYNKFRKPFLKVHRTEVYEMSLQEFVDMDKEHNSLKPIYDKYLEKYPDTTDFCYSITRGEII